MSKTDHALPKNKRMKVAVNGKSHLMSSPPLCAKCETCCRIAGACVKMVARTPLDLNVLNVSCLKKKQVIWIVETYFNQYCQNVAQVTKYLDMQEAGTHFKYFYPIPDGNTEDQSLLGVQTEGIQGWYVDGLSHEEITCEIEGKEQGIEGKQTIP